MTSRRQLYAAGEPLGDSVTRREGARVIFGGGGGGRGPDKYANLEKLYGEQAESARLLRGLAEANLPGVTDGYMRSVNETLDPGYAEKQAGQAQADMASANAMERAAINRDLTSMGVNPNDPRFAGSLRRLESANAARMAAGANAARFDAKNYQRAVAQDAIGTFTGQSNMAANQMSSATSGMSNLAQQQQQAQMNKDAQKQNAASAAVGGTLALMSLKDGGKVKTVERHMLGGTAGGQQHGFFQTGQVTAPPAQAQRPQQSPVSSAMAGAKQGNQLKQLLQNPTAGGDKMANVVAKVGGQQAGANVGAQSAGMRMSAEQAGAARDAYMSAAKEAAAAGDPAAAQQYMDLAANISDGAGLGAEVATEVAGSQGLASAAGAVPGASSTVTGALGSGGMSTAAGASVPGATSTISGALGAGGMSTGATTAATSTLAGTAGAGSAAMAAVGTALPWIGAAMAVGSLLGAWKNGGKVEKVGNSVDLRDDGGKVPGEWRGNDDTVPALLTEGEHVINAEAAAMIGHATLERLNKKGLAQRKKGKTPKDIKRVGLGALA